MQKEVDIENIKKICKEHKIVWTSHVLIRLLQRNISQIEVESAIINREVIEQYPDDYPNPSCLILGITDKEIFLHIVCGISDNNLWIITAYKPAPEKWSKDLKTRIEGGTNE